MRPVPTWPWLLLSGALLVGGARAQESGLPITSLPEPAEAPALRPRLAPTLHRLSLTGVWRAESFDRVRGPTTGLLRFVETPDGAYRVERVAEVAPGAPGRLLASGAARIDEQGRVLLREEPPQEGVGLLRRLDEGLLPDVRGGVRRAVLAPGPYGQTLSGVFSWSDGRGAGRERLVRVDQAPRDNAVDLLVDGPEMFPLLREALAQARRTIHLQTYIYTDDPTGRSVAALLMERAGAGVEVRVLVDATGDFMGERLKTDLRAAGVEVIVQHGLVGGFFRSVADVGRGVWDFVRRLFGAKPKPRERRGILNHDHRKIAVVDGEVAFIGGMNIADEYEHELHDVHARVRGSAVAELEALFLDRWKAAGGRLSEEVRAPAPEPGPPRWGPGRLPVDVVASLPGISTAIKDRYLREIAGADRRVMIEMAYFLDDDIIDGLQDARRRGVRALVILPSDEHNDVPIVADAFSWVQNDVVRSGIELYKYRGRHVHAKVASFDGHTATVGSSNLDNLALTKLAEANLFVRDPAFVRQVDRRIFATDVPRSDRVRVQRQGWWQKIRSGTLHFFRGVL